MIIRRWPEVVEEMEIDRQIDIDISLMTSSDACGAVLASSCIKGCLRAGAMYNISRHVFLTNPQT